VAILFCFDLPRSCLPLASGAGSMVGGADRMGRPGRAAIDAVVASGTIEAEEDRLALCSSA
jgi:hypothetical protein